MNHTVFEYWKIKILKDMGISFIELSLEDWIVIFLALDNYKGVDSRQKLHTMLFLYPLINVAFKPTFMGVFSPEIEKAFKKLIDTGYIEKSYTYNGGETSYKYILSEKGRNKAKILISLLSKKWVFDSKRCILKRGENAITELESIKKAHLSKSNLALLNVVIKKVLEKPIGKLLIDAEQKEIVREVKIILERRRV